MYVPVDSNVNPNFNASYPGVSYQIDCAATETYTGTVTNTSCDATITGGTVSGEKGYRTASRWYHALTSHLFSCMSHRVLQGLATGILWPQR